VVGHPRAEIAPLSERPARHPLSAEDLGIVYGELRRPAPVFAEIRTASGILAIASTATVAILGDQAPKPASNSTIIIEFLVTDVDAEFARLQNELADIVLEPTTMPWGNRSTLFRNPDGNLMSCQAARFRYASTGSDAHRLQLVESSRFMRSRIPPSTVTPSGIGS
jgi:uncharacterized glyoxalase superfamily protein PhnB